MTGLLPYVLERQTGKHTGCSSADIICIEGVDLSGPRSTDLDGLSRFDIFGAEVFEFKQIAS